VSDAGCGGSAELYASGGCGNGDAGDDAAAAAAVTIPADGNCHSGLFAAATASIESAILDAGVVSQGSCAPSGGQANGSVTPESQTLYCCQN
jgi:hypothetical protein